MLLIKRIELEHTPGSSLRSVVLGLMDISRRHHCEVTTVFDGVQLTKGIGDGLGPSELELMFYTKKSEARFYGKE